MVARWPEKEQYQNEPQFYPSDKMKEEPSEPATSAHDITYEVSEADESAHVVQE